MHNYHTVAKESRLKVLELVYKAGTSHIGSLMGCADIMAILMAKIDYAKDKFIAGKSWVAALLYYHLWLKGKITLEQLDSFCQSDSKFIGLVEAVVPEIPFGVGSMGMGFPASVGFALSKKLKGEEGIVYCLMSDGEQAIGTTHESALIAAHHNLDNLVVVVDRNGLQAMGETEKVLSIEPLGDMWETWGWDVHVVSGHDFSQMESALVFKEPYSPKVVICNTTKGKGVSFMEHNNLWHYAQVKEDDYHKAYTELCLK